jgi:hypothetical protein
MEAAKTKVAVNENGIDAREAMFGRAGTLTQRGVLASVC